MRYATPMFALLVAACGPASLGGSVDGEKVGGASDAFFDSIRWDFGPLGEFEMVVVMVTEFSDGCDVLEEFFNTVEFTCDELCDEYVSIADTYRLRSDDTWTLVMSANVSDGIDGDFDFDEGSGEGEFSGDFFSWDTRPLQDIDSCEDACEDGEALPTDVDGGKSGTLELEEDGDRIKGRFDIQLGGDDAVDGRFTAHECDMDDWIWFL